MLQHKINTTTARFGRLLWPLAWKRKTDVTPAILSRDKVAVCKCACHTLQLCPVNENWPISLIISCLCNKVALWDMHSCIL